MCNLIYHHFVFEVNKQKKCLSFSYEKLSNFSSGYVIYLYLQTKKNVYFKQGTIHNKNNDKRCVSIFVLFFTFTQS